MKVLYIGSNIILNLLNHKKKSKVLVILNGHVIHSKKLAATCLAHDLAQECVSLPPHITHRLQPLDVASFGPLDTYYDEVMRKFRGVYKNFFG